MASLERLSIWGIRSFGNGPEDKQYISFEKPLTLILGDNGCGKSTIIECLRYITAQKEPAKGVFVHDPNLTASSTVKAVIKLHLKNSKGESVHLSKAMQATRNKKTISIKSLDAAITMWDPISQKDVSLSNRCADFSPEVIRILGVSKAILENVIFCTQEDAHWPLDSDQKLKEKFDQIFDSEKYNKCLKKVRDTRKALVEEKKNRDTELKFLKENKNSALRKRNELDGLNREIQALDDELEQLNASLAPIGDQLKEVEKKEKEISKLYTTTETTKAELASAERAEKELQSKVCKANCEFLGSDNELEMALYSCEVQSRNENELKSELSILKNKEMILSRDISTGNEQVGKLTKVIEINKSKILEKNESIHKLASILGITDSNPTEDDLDRSIREKQTSLQQLQQEHEFAQEDLQSQAEKAREDVISKECEVKKNEEALKENLNESETLKKQLGNFKAALERRERIKNELCKVEENLASHNKKENANVLSAELIRSQNALDKVESRLNNLENDLKLLQSHAEVGSKLEMLKEEVSLKSNTMQRLRNYHQEVFIDVLGTMPEEGFKKAIDDHVELLNQNIRELRVQKTSLEGKVITYKNNGVTLSASLQKTNCDLQSFEDQVNELTNGEDLDLTVDRVAKNVKALQDERGTLRASEYLYQRLIKNMQHPKPCCPLCKRGFFADEETSTVIDQANSTIRDIPANLDKISNELIGLENQLTSLRALQSQHVKVDNLRNEVIPNIMKEQDENRRLVTKVRQELDEVEKQLVSAEKAREKCLKMLGDMALLDQTICDITKISLEIKKLQAILPESWTKQLLSDAEENKANLLTERRQKLQARDDAQRCLTTFNERLSLLQSEKHNLAEEERRLWSNLGQRQQQEERLVQLQGLQETLKVSFQNAQMAVYQLQEIHQQRTRDLKQLKEKQKAIEREMMHEQDELAEHFNNIKRLQREIVEFEQKGEEKVLISLREEIEDKQECWKALKSQIEDTNSKLGSFAKLVVRRRELEDNKAWREKQHEVTLIKNNLKQLEESFSKMGHDFLIKEKKKLKMEEERIGLRKSSILGKRGAIEGQVDALGKELNSSMYRDIDARYKEELIQLRISEGLAADLLRYANAMDYAMGIYHDQQMKRVNSIVREYWRKIYRGNDVDYIEIYTEKAEVSEHRRSFNYKLVQIKGDATLDMRNRCSAGQKMLASLIIRMALAEVFSNNCGILTLDEPTTNLDRKNIRNLANTLNELIATKQSLTKTNFQLIVITHDRDFLDELISVNAVEKYVEVSRNREGKSQLSVRTV